MFRQGLASLVTLVAAVAVFALSSQLALGESYPETEDAALLTSAPRMAAVFVANAGQWGNEAGFALQQGRVNAYLSESKIRLSVAGEGGNASAGEISWTFIGAEKVTPSGTLKSNATFNYFRGNDPSSWQRDVGSFKEITYRALYEGVDLRVAARPRGFKYEFHVSPEASVSDIEIRYGGVERLSLDESGALKVKTPWGIMTDSAPVVYQDGPEGRVEVGGGYRLLGKYSYGFELTGEYDESLPLVIDPELSWGTYLTISEMDYTGNVAVDSEGNVWITGHTDSAAFPVPGGFDTANGYPGDAYILKFDIDGDLVWGTFLGGDDGGSYDAMDWGHDIVVTPGGKVWVVGETHSLDFPVPGGFDTTFNGTPNTGDVFIARISASGSLEYGTYYGGTGHDVGDAIAFAPGGGAYITGWTTSTDLPVTGGFDQVHNGKHDAFVAKIDSDGQFAWGSFIGGSEMDWGRGIAASCQGVYVTGNTDSADFVPTGGFDLTYGGDSDAYIVRASPTGALLWSTFLGGSDRDRGYGIATDKSSCAIVVGYTRSADFPLKNGFGPSAPAIADAYVTKVSPSGQIVWSTLLGGSSGDDAWDVAVDGYGSAWVTGTTDSSDFPLVNPTDDTLDDCDAFLAKISSDCSLLFSTYLGGSDYEEAYGVDANDNGVVATLGVTYSEDFPTPNGYDTTLEEGYDLYVATFIDDELPFAYVAPQDGAVLLPGGVQTFEFEVDSDIWPVFICFSSSEDMPRRSRRLPSGAMERTLRYPLRPGATSWTPSQGQWKQIRKLAEPGGSIYWCLMGRMPGYTDIYGPAWSFCFDCGQIVDLDVTPSHDVGADEAVWPNRYVPIEFSWTDGTSGMSRFVVVVSSDPAIPMRDRKKTVVLGRRGVPGSPYVLSRPEWKRVRKLATWQQMPRNGTPAEGVLWWAVRGTDADGILACWSEPKKLIVDGGEWTLGDLDLGAYPPEVFWTHTGDGLAWYNVEFSVSADFPPTSRKTLRMPARPVKSAPYSLTAGDIRRLGILAARNGVSTLYYRVCGHDADKSFTAYSDFKTIAIP